MRIATGQIEDTTTEDGKNAAAGAHGRQGASGRHVGQKAQGDSQEGRKSPLGLTDFSFAAGVTRVLMSLK